MSKMPENEKDTFIDFTLRALAKSKATPYERPPDDVANDKHQSMLEAIAPYAKKTEQKNLTPLYVNYKTRKTKLILVTCPEWSPQFIPFNITRLSGVAKSAGYETEMMDLNVLCYNEYKNVWQPNNTFSFRLWDPAGAWHWEGEFYHKEIHPKIEYFLKDAAKKIIDYNPDLVGFSMYATSEEPTKWLCQELKRLNPNIKIAVGGSNVQKGWFNIHPYYDYVVSGEGEQILLEILEELENGIMHSETKVLTQPVNQRIDLNSLPMPDYESIDFNLYEIPNGVTNEFSRGCTAKCTFCEETHFWKYRQRHSVDLLSEVEWLYYNKGVDLIWFIDSLVNGNLKELRAFAKGIAAKGLNIKWTGYSRCDGRMDLDYYKDLAAGGCIMLNYGIESGSQQVLDAMDKKVTVAEMEANFKHGKEVGILAATNWMVGFPTETLQDLADNLTFLWRMRNMNINNIGVGFGFGLGAETIVGQNPESFGLSHHKYQGHWITKDFTKGGTHIMCRVKIIYMFLDLLLECTEKPFGYPKRPNLREYHYKIKFNDPKKINEIEYEVFDYNIIKPNINSFADSLVNEMWPYLRLLWRTRGGYEIEILFNPEIDIKEFGYQYGPEMYTASFKFKISDSGDWFADFNFDFKQIDNHLDNRDPPPKGRKGPFFAQDYSRLKSNAAIRARILAKPPWGAEGRNDKDFWELLEEERMLNETIDFTFNYRYQQRGSWRNNQDFSIPVPGSKNKKNISIPIIIDKQ